MKIVEADGYLASTNGSSCHKTSYLLSEVKKKIKN